MKPIETVDKCTTCSTCVAYCPVTKATRAFKGPKLTGPSSERFRLYDETGGGEISEIEALDYCSNCKNCDIACPSGVKISTLNMLARAEYCKRHKPPLRDWVLSHGRMLGRLARRFPGWLVNVGSTNALTRLILDKFGVDARAPMPVFVPRSFTEWMGDHNAMLTASDRSRLTKKAVFFPGCYVNDYDPQTGKDLVFMLEKAGYERSEALTLSREITAEGKVTGVTRIVNEPTKVVVTKLDPDKQPVEGATYEFYDAAGKKVADVKTDKEGKLTVKYLPAGKYTYKETKAPSGYALNPTAYAFEIDEKGVVAGTLIVTDPFANIVIKKVDAKTNKLLAGAQFGLYDSTDKLLTTLTTDNNGLVQFTKLPWGKYSVKELKAPSGYAVNGKLVTVEINETYQNPAEPHVVENSPAAQTGVDGFPWWGIALLAVCVLGGGGCAWYLLRKKQPAVDKRRAKHN